MPVSPRSLKECFEAAGYTVIDETDHNWLMARGDKDEPFIIPKKGKLVPVDVMMKAFGKAGPDGVRKHLYAAVRKAAGDPP